MQTVTANKVFQFFRGALRGAYGEENLRDKIILFVGMNKFAQEVLNKLCLDGVTIYFSDTSIQNYRNAYTLCGTVLPWLGDEAHVILDFEKNQLMLKNRPFSFDLILEDAYTQGIHEYYL